MATAKTLFSPTVHGFQFTNSFDFSFAFDLPFLPPVNLGNLVYGLCGGMCFGALDYFHAGRPVPAQSAAPADGSALHLYLAERQVASFTLPRVPLKVMEWMLMDDKAVWELTAEKEFGKLRANLEAHKPSVLALIRGKGVSDPTVNHQVVALGYDLDEATQQVTIDLYDPNHPREAPHLTLSLAETAPGITQSTGELLRGFFVITYRQHAPPAG